MELLPLFQWLENTTLGDTVRQSLWLFPVIESFHLVGLAVLGGLVLLVDLRALGIGLKQPISELARETHPWLVGSVVMMLVTGILLFLSEAVKCYYNGPFWIKMYALAGALVFTFTVRRKVTRMDDARANAVTRRVVAVISILLWGTVAWGGRWIAFGG